MLYRLSGHSGPGKFQGNAPEEKKDEQVNICLSEGSPPTPRKKSVIRMKNEKGIQRNEI